MKKTIILLVITLGLIGLVVKWIFFPPPALLTNPGVSKQQVKTNIVASNIVKAYSDPSGFTFNYPDNLSLTNNEATDSASYADLKLTAQGVDGSLNIKIMDSKFKTLDSWAKSISLASPKSVSLGNLKGQELTSNDQVLLGALDSGVLFTVQVPFAQNRDFWLNVYKKVIADFSFVQPVKADNSSSSGDSGSSDAVSFEGEEVVQ